MHKKAKIIASVICVVALVGVLAFWVIQSKQDSLPVPQETGSTVSNDSTAASEPEPVTTAAPELETATEGEEPTETTVLDTTEAATENTAPPAFSIGTVTQNSENTTTEEPAESQSSATLPPETPQKGDQGTDWV